MPCIKPISDLRNYTEVLKDVDTNRRVYLTRNGHGVYAIMSMDEVDFSRNGIIHEPIYKFLLDGCCD